MNKKLQNGLVVAVSAAMGTGIVAPVYAAAATGTDLGAQYKAAYDATQAALASKSQKDLTSARVLVDGLYQAVKGTKDEYLATTLSSLLDPAQQTKLVELFSAIAKADASVKQADINASRDLILAMPAQWINTFSSRIDTIQQKMIDKVNAAVVKAEASKLDADKTAAQALVTEIKTVTNNAGVATWATAMETRANAVVTAVKVSSVSAATATSLKVTFSAPVDTTKATFDVERGTTSKTEVSNLTVTWNDAKTVATLEYNAILPTDTYTVTVAGTGISTTDNIVTTTVADQAVAKVKILSNDLIKNASGTAVTLSYKVYDQYGTDITSTVSASDLSVNAVIGSNSYSQAASNLSVAPSTGTITITKASGFVDAETTGVVTIVYATNGVNATATMKLASSASVNSVTFGANILPTGYTNIQAGNSPAVTVPLTVKDQYGNTMTDISALGSSLTIVSSDPTNVGFVFANDDNDNAVLQMNAASATPAETVVLTLINPTSGQSWTKTFNIVKAATPTKLTVGNFSASTVAKGDTFALPLTVTDQFGNTMTNADIAANASTIFGWMNNIRTFASDAHINVDPNSSNYGKLVGTVDNSGTFVLVFNSISASNTAGNLTTKTVTVSEQRVGNYVTNLANINMIQGSTKSLEFGFKDQYNTAIEYGDVVDNGAAAVAPATLVAPSSKDLSYKVTLTKVSGDTGAVTLDDSTNVTGVTGNAVVTAGSEYTGTDIANAQDIKVITDSAKTGSYKVTLSIMDGTSTVSSASTTITVVKNNVAGLTYSVNDIIALNGSGTTTGTAIGTYVDNNSADHVAASTNPYAQKVVVTAVDASGNSYTINKADIVSVTASSSKVVVASAPNASGDWYVAGNNLAMKGMNSSPQVAPADATATLTVSVNTLDGIKTFTKTVTVSASSPSISKLNVIGQVVASPVATTNTTVTDTWTNHLTITDTAANFANATGVAINVVGLNQFNVWTPVTDAKVVVNSTDLAPSDAFSLVGGKLALKAGYSLPATSIGKDIKATIMVGSVSIQIIVKVQ